MTSGTLSVATPGGWADVYIDGVRSGSTRTEFRQELPAGRVRIELRPFGLAPTAGDTAMRRTVTIGARPVHIVVPLDA